jgi:hypothetical protein
MVVDLPIDVNHGLGLRAELRPSLLRRTLFAGHIGTRKSQSLQPSRSFPILGGKKPFRIALDSREDRLLDGLAVGRGERLPPG